VVPGGKPATTPEVPVPVVVFPPGLLVNVHVPVDGKPFKTIRPVGTKQVGWVLVPTKGAVGVVGAALITTLAEATELQLAAFLTVNV
jgi:hypothetical protein